MPSRLPAAQLLSPATRFGMSASILSLYVMQSLTRSSSPVLNVPVAGMEEILLSYIDAAEDVSDQKKEALPLAIDLCRPGWFPLPSSSTDLKDEASTTDTTTRRRNQKASGKRPKKDIAREELDAKLKDNRAIEICVAHIECIVDSRDLMQGQTVLYAMIER